MYVVLQTSHTNDIQPSLESPKESMSSDVAMPFNLWMNRTKCGSVSYDLPNSASPFVGREKDMTTILNRLTTSHIVSISGAPGFGKSLLAIHIGYEMVKRGTTVRYIDAADKLSYLKYFTAEESDPVDAQKDKFASREPRGKKHRTSSNKGAVEVRGEFPAALQMDSILYANDKVIDELLKWGREVQCHTLLILDNCDDLVNNEVPREKLIHLIKTMIKRSNQNLHIVMTSRQRLFLVDDFENVVIKELNQTASVELLLQLSPQISKSHAELVATLVEGCPLALKVVGKLLHNHGDILTKKLQDELANQPIKLLDKASSQRERFGALMDVMYEQLGANLQQCGYYVSLFPGSFEHEAALAILPVSLTSQETKCLESFHEHSLVEEYNLVQLTYYKMHRLIREYFRERGALHTKAEHDYAYDFNTNFCTHFTTLLLQHATQMKILNFTEIDQYRFSLDLHNIHHSLRLLISKAENSYSTKEVIALAFAVGEGLISANSIKDHFHLLISKVNQTCYYLTDEKCGNLFSMMTKELYQECRCTSVKYYIIEVFDCSCMNIFQCESVSEIIQHPNILSKLDKLEIEFLSRSKQNCDSSPLNSYYCFFNLCIPTIVLKVTFYLHFIVVIILAPGPLSRHYASEGFQLVMMQIIFITISLHQTYYYEIMEWMVVVFPTLVMHIFRLLFIVFLYTLPLFLIKSFSVYKYNISVSYLHYDLVRYFLIMCTLCCGFFDIVIFGRLVPYCY